MFKFFLCAACALTHNTYLYATCKRHVLKGLVSKEHGGVEATLRHWEFVSVA